MSFGWRREYDTDAAGRIVDWRAVEADFEADVVREIVTRLLSGDTIRGIADDLNRREVPTPSRRPSVIWRHSTVRKVALRPANIGKRVHHGEVIGEAAWPAIVDRDQHDRVTALLSSPERRVSRDAARRHLLTYGIGKCGVCGGVLRWVNARRGKQQLPMYACEGKGCVGRNQDRVDAFVAAVVVERLGRPDAVEVLTRDDSAASEARDRLEALRARLDTAADQYADGAIDGQQLARITAKLRPDLERAEGALRKASAGTVLEHVGDLAGEKAREVWDGLDVVRRRKVLDALGVTVAIMPTRRGPGFRPEDVVIEWGGA